MVGIVLVSHSRPLALGLKVLVQAMTGAKLPLAVAAGVGEDRAELGTDAVEIAEAIRSVMSEDGVLVLMDMGSAILSAETALDLVDRSLRSKIRLSSGPFLEGAIAAGVTANLGAGLNQVAYEAEHSLHQKLAHFELEPESSPAISVDVSGGETTPAPSPAASWVFAVKNAHGLHARPSARLIRESARFQADVTVENVTGHKGPVSARSLSALASLEVRQGQEMRVTATGPEAQQALQAIRILVESGLGDHVATVATGRASASLPGRAQPVAEGIAFGPMLFQTDQPMAVPQHPAEGLEQEAARLHAALATARANLLQQRQRAERLVGADNADIFAAQAMLLDDPALRQRAEDLIVRHQASAAWAWHEAFREVAAKFRGLGDEYLRQRATDIDDIGRRVLSELGVQAHSDLPLNRPGVLVVDELTPTQASQLQGSQVAGVICLDGGATSHSAILLRAFGLPCIAQARPMLVDLARERKPAHLAFDGGTGEVWIDPDDHQLADLTARRDHWKAHRLQQLRVANQPAVTTDGHVVEVLANVAQLADAEAAVRHGAEGVGLLRTEFLFLHRAAAPTEDEQVAALAPIAQLSDGRPLVIRTLDAGGDKELPYLGLSPEANPFLGVRGLRVCLRQPALFETQLRALLRVGVNHQLRLMFPMVSDPTELQQAIRHLESAHATLAGGHVPHLWPVSVGIMVEVPSAAIMADDLAQLCDFFSIGTNDLTQYTLAADRGNAELSAFQDALHPAVLLLIQRIVDAAHRHGKRVAVCGEAAADVPAALLFVGLGVDELSVNPRAVPGIKAAMRATSLKVMQDLAREAVRQTSADGVRRQVALFEDSALRS
jgi:phosphoenolpyruvate-protein phosphotransferase/dihydroxyacetone kinase phosphotransfer subunit